ncbi:L-threonylcarbamoyladenylate synthase [Comamonas antarctica]|uniref:Threonylcarbamoyl-AMP synthase n=1 Tax=Comamonas antarctica TaxID=2743470 RepID=A0A6N1WZN4_9BURK|nr:L-threonylcarbamoyladenylate synthase [Comamonas antarctica]QKV51543.1 threonylcarbamoyl-AMP synthase [Comamonas antarctica]
MILPGNLPTAIDEVARALQRGALLGLPTETVYGLAADAENDAAVAAIFAAKGRPSNHPLIVHVADAPAITRFAKEVPVFAQQLIDAFWPGPLTLILPRRAGMVAAATGGQDSVGLRCPSHPVAHSLLQACMQLQPPVWGVAAPSANRFGRVSPTTAAHVQSEFGPELLVLDGGECAVGIESTIVDCTRGVPVLLRPGAVSRDDIERACGLKPLSKDELPDNTPRASGTLLAHYAPDAKVRLMDAAQLQAGLDLLGADAAHLGVYARSPLQAGAGVELRRMPEDAAATAQELFSQLREFDAAGVRLLWIETPPATPAWEGVRDRLQRAAAA